MRGGGFRGPGGFKRGREEGNGTMERGRNNFAPKARNSNVPQRLSTHKRPGDGDDETPKSFQGSVPLDQVEELCGVTLHPDLIKQMKEKLEYTSLFPIQAQTLKAILGGREILAKARTGSGKTLGFALPIIQQLMQNPRSNRKDPYALILAPTRELAIQSHRVFEGLIPAGAPIQSMAVYGGHHVSIQRQEIFNLKGLDIVVGTPGRVIDFLESNTIRLTSIRVVCLDEADRMLDEGFGDDVEKILKNIPEKKFQFLLFSATVPDWVTTVVKRFGRDKEHEVIDLVGNDTVTVSETVAFYELLAFTREEKHMVLGDLIRVYAGTQGRVIVFTETKAECHELGISSLLRSDVQTLHGDMTQENREKTMQAFRDGKFNTLIATDVAARGLDIPRIDLVIQTSVPKDGDSFIHRAGRTGRAGRRGVCIVIRNRYDDIRRLQHKCGVEFESLTAPTQADVMSAISRDVAHQIELVDDKVTEWFSVAATGLMDGKSHEEGVVIVAKALALLSGYTKKEKGRSLIGNRLGACTIMYKCTDPASYYFRRLPLGAILDHIDEVVGPNTRRNVRHVTTCGNATNGMYAVFDMDEAEAEKAVEKFKNVSEVSFEVIESLPADYVPRTDQR